MAGTHPDAVGEAPAAGLSPALLALHQPARLQQRSECIHQVRRVLQRVAKCVSQLNSIVISCWMLLTLSQAEADICCRR